MLNEIVAENRKHCDPVSEQSIFIIYPRGKGYDPLWRWCRFCDVGFSPPSKSTLSVNCEGNRLYYWDDSIASPVHTLPEAISKDLFFDIARDKYPEFAEWLLFHQEWF